MDDGPHTAAQAEHHDRAEFAAAWDGMSQGDLLRLRKVAELMQRGPLLTRQDLFQEVYLRVLQGARPWPRGVGLVPFIVGVMRSVADEFAKRQARARSIAPVPAEGTAGEVVAGLAGKTGVIMMPLGCARSPEEEIIAAQEAEEEARQLAGWREQVLSSLDGDYDAQMMVEGMLDGQKGAALQALVGLPDKEFASKQRKVRRCIEKLKAEAPNRRGRP